MTISLEHPANADAVATAATATTDSFRPPRANVGAAGSLTPPTAPKPARELGLDLYRDTVDLSESLTPGQREAYQRNLLKPGMPTWAFVVLSVITLGLFPTIYLQLKQGKLPVVKRNDPSAGKAIGFLFIPVFNIYWCFIVWRRLVDRINFQYRLRGHSAPITPSEVTAAQILALCRFVPSPPFIILGLLGCVWLVVLAAQVHSALNRLALGTV